MTDSYVGVNEPGSVTKKLDTEQLTSGSDTVQRERMEIGGASLLEIAAVKNAEPASNAYGVAVRPVGQAALLGDVVETAPATDTASSGLNGRLQRVAQRLTTLLTGIILAAGEAFIGKVGGSNISIAVSPTVTASATNYTSGDAVGGIQTLAAAARVSGGTTMLQSILVQDAGNKLPRGNILIFNVSPGAATTIDNSAFVYSTDFTNLVAVIPLAQADWVTINSKPHAELKNLGLGPLTPSGSANLFAVFVCNANFNFFAAATDLKFTYSFIRD